MSDRRPWTDEELGFLQDHAYWSSTRIAKELDRSAGAIKFKRRQLRTGWSPKLQHWTDDEDALLLELGAFASAEQLTDRFPGRTAEAIKNRRVQLGMTTNFRKFDPHTVGARPLLAKTCSACGRLLQADWFKYVSTKGGYWQSHCRKCQAAEAADWRSRVDYAQVRQSSPGDRADFLARMEALTRPRADRHGEPYTEADHAVLTDPDLTVLQKALKIGRTYLATKQACAANGYRSHIGLGEPTDLWRIFNPNEPAA